MCNFKFELEQPFLTPHTSRIPYERPVASDNAVTRNDDGNIVFAIATGGGTDDFGVAKSFSEIHIADGFAVRNFKQFSPNPFLKIGALLVYRQFKIPTVTMEKFNELLGALVHDLGNAGFAMRELIRVVNKSYFTNIMFRASDLQEADGAFVVSVVQFSHG